VGGRVEVESEVGKRTAIRLVLPLTVAISHVLVIGVGDQHYALPTANLVGALAFSDADVHRLAGSESLLLDGEVVPIVRLAHLLGVTSAQPSLRRICLLLRGAGGRVAYQVDELVDEQELFIKPLGKVLERCAFFQGGAIDSDGRVVPVLDLAALSNAGVISRATTLTASPAESTQPPSQPARATRRILVVDDSLTTRELERSILAVAGYEVQVAVNGLEAIEYLQKSPFDLLVSDVDMPHLNGFELTEWVRGNSAVRELPVVIVSGQESPEDRRRGLEAGANSYILKSTFDQDSLLQTVEGLIG